MAEHEFEKKRPPLWRTSEGRLREASPAPRKDGRDHLTGYEPAQKEGRDRPREAARLSGSYGDVAVGTTKKKQVTLAVSRRRSREGPPAGREEQTLHAESAQQMNLARGEFRVNAHKKEGGAMVYREDREKASVFLLERFREMMRTHRPALAEEQMPFLNRQEEREELRRLQSREEDLRAAGEGGHRSELRAVERRRQELRQSLSEKETQERRLRLMLDRAQEESRRRTGETETVPTFQTAVESAAPDDGGKPGGKPGKGKKKPPQTPTEGSGEEEKPKKPSAQEKKT